MPPPNGLIHVEYSTMKNAMIYDTEAELGGLFENRQKVTATRMALAEMGYQQPPAPVAIDNTAANSIVNVMGK